jgi:hypothetical protein
MTSPPYTRRRILAAIGGAGALYVGADLAGAALGLDPVDLNQRTVSGTYAQANGFTDGPPRIALSWREILNGEVQEDTGLTEDTTGDAGDVGLIVDEAVMPGDSGSVTMRAELLEREGETDDAELYLLCRLTETAENGLTEPELDAGDDPNSTEGELDDETQLSIWVDEGIFTGNGELEDLPVIGDDTVAQGRLSEVSKPPEEGGIGGNALNNEGGYQISIDGETCHSVGEEVYVSFRWEIPEGAGNIIQGDSARFQVVFDPRPCS